MTNKIIKIPNFLFPKKEINLKKWSVVACDQYTSQPDYWEKVNDFVGKLPSTLNIIYPEVYLGKIDRSKKIKSIHNYMEKYANIYLEEKKGFVLINREIENSVHRKGLLVCLDLEEYDYQEGSQTPIRATEGTVIDRLPPRIEVRENALLETPHIMVLIDNPKKDIIEPLFENKEEYNLLYDFDLMMDSGHITGHLINDEKTLKSIISKLDNLENKQEFADKYEVSNNVGPLAFAVGDGNHSLATAKAIWEKTKKSLNKEEIENHPARFAMVEIVNVFDTGLIFEPIHRVLFNSIEFFDFVKNSKFDVTISDKISNENLNKHVIKFKSKDKSGYIIFNNPTHNLTVGSLQELLDDYLENNEKSSIDYIHGKETVSNFANKKNNIGFYLPSIKKEDLFKTVIYDGVLPRKTFSMGEASEKRFYIECRKIR